MQDQHVIATLLLISILIFIFADLVLTLILFVQLALKIQFLLIMMEIVQHVLLEGQMLRNEHVLGELVDLYLIALM
jgi:hypothetical protein